jgi:hypothetical protein
MMAATSLWCRITVLDAQGHACAGHSVEGTGEPDLAVVDAIARAALAAKRQGGAIILSQVTPPLRSLLALSGSAVDVQGQVEFGEEPLRAHQSQEELHPTDEAI